MLLKTEGNKCPTKCKKDVSDGENVGKIFNRTFQMECGEKNKFVLTSTYGRWGNSTPTLQR